MPNPNVTLSTLNATIHWGDGTQSAGQISLNNGIYSVQGTHTYAEEGSNAVSVTINDTNASLTATANTTDNTAESLIILSNVANFNGTEGQSFSNVIVATFTIAANESGSYTATINWGDNQSSAGTISFDNVNNVYDVLGTHIYTSAGFYTVTAATIDDGIANPVSPVTEQALIAGVAPIVTTAGALGNFNPGNAISTNANGAELATFYSSYAGSQDPGGYYAANIAWGDGTTDTVDSNVIIQAVGTAPNGSTLFGVFDNHTYSSIGSYTITVNVRMIGVPVNGVSTTDTLTVTNPITLTGGNNFSFQQGKFIASSGSFQEFQCGICSLIMM